MRTTTLLLGLALVAASGCQTRPIGHFGDAAFYHARGHYRIRYGATPTQLLPSGWRLANYRHDADGAPTEEHVDTIELDTAQLVGRGRSRVLRVPKVDLLYQQQGGSAEIWVRTLVLPTAWEQASAEQILHTWAASAEHGDVPIDPLERPSGGGEATLTHYGSAVVDGLPAHWVELDVRRGDVLERVTVVAVRPLGHHWRVRRRVSLPMLMMFGYASAPDEHETVRQDFEQLVERVDIRR